MLQAVSLSHLLHTIICYRSSVGLIVISITTLLRKESYKVQTIVTVGSHQVLSIDATLYVSKISLVLSSSYRPCGGSCLHHHSTCMLVIGLSIHLNGMEVCAVFFSLRNFDSVPHRSL